MTERTCKEEGCEKPGHQRGWCWMHYWRWRKYGTTDAPPARTPLTRFMAKVVVADDGCWLWQGKLTPTGYARFQVNGRTVAVHRWAYEHFIGPAPDDLVMDHLCRRHSCVNPNHVEPVTIRENVHRGLAVALRPPFDHANDPLRIGDKPVCKQGHPFEGDNLYVSPSGRTHCRTCRRAGVAALRERRRQARLTSPLAIDK